MIIIFKAASHQYLICFVHFQHSHFATVINIFSVSHIVQTENKNGFSPGNCCLPLPLKKSWFCMKQSYTCGLPKVGQRNLFAFPSPPLLSYFHLERKKNTKGTCNSHQVKQWLAFLSFFPSFLSLSFLNRIMKRWCRAN